MNVTVLQTTPITGTMLHQLDAVEIGPNGVETNRRFYLVDDRGRVVVAPAAVHQRIATERAGWETWQAAARPKWRSCSSAVRYSSRRRSIGGEDNKPDFSRHPPN